MKKEQKSFDFFPKNQKANLLTENIVFIILNLIFISILIVFLFSRIGSAAILEEKYAKQIVLIIDSAKPNMTIILDMKDAINEKEEGFLTKNIVNINDNLVTVKLREKGGYSYSFFNDIKINQAYFIEEKKELKYRLKFGEYKNEK